MSKNKGFSDTSAERYSLALYELANESNSLDIIENHSVALLNLIKSNKDFSNLIKDPTVKQKSLILIVEKISENSKIDNLLKNFMIFLVNKRRFFYLEKILVTYMKICSKKRGEINGEIQSAKKLSSDEIKKITEDLVKNFSSKIKLTYRHDESLIGGLVIKVGSTMVDTSIKNKLQQIENRMIEA